MNEDQPISWDILKNVDPEDRRRYYLDLFPDALHIGRTLPWGFILDCYLPDLAERQGQNLKTAVASLVEDGYELEQESKRFKELFEQHVDHISSLDHYFAAIANTTRKAHFINVLAVLAHTPLETLPGIPQEQRLDRDFWENLQKIVEEAKLE